MTETDADRRKKLLYRANHRGFKEADLVFGGFAAAHLEGMSAAELDEFEALLALPDHRLFAYVKGGEAPPAELLGPIFERLQRFDVAALIGRVTTPR